MSEQHFMISHPDYSNQPSDLVVEYGKIKSITKVPDYIVKRNDEQFEGCLNRALYAMAYNFPQVFMKLYAEIKNDEIAFKIAESVREIVLSELTFIFSIKKD